MSPRPCDQCHHGLVTVIFKPPLPTVPKSLCLLSLKRSWIFLNKTLTKSLTNSKKKNIQRHAYTTNIFMQAFTIIIFSSSWLKSSKHVCLQDFKGLMIIQKKKNYTRLGRSLSFLSFSLPLVKTYLSSRVWFDRATLAHLGLLFITIHE